MRFKLNSPAIPISLGVILRLLNIKFILAGPVLKTLIIDSAFYHNRAMEIAGGDVLGEGVFFMSPLYSYLMGLIYAVMGAHPAVIAIFQALLSGVTLWLLWSLGKRIAGESAGLIAVWLGAFYPVWIYFDGVILTASLILFLNTAGLWALVRWFDGKHPGWLIMAGLALGLSALARPGILFFVVFAGVWLFIKRYHLAAALLIIWALAAVSGAAIRNIIVSGEFALTTASGGMNFYVGSNPKATGLYVEPDFLNSAEPDYELQDYMNEAKRLSWKDLNAVETSRFWYKMGLLYLIEHPLRAVELWWNKIFYFWNNLEAPNNVSIYLVKRYSPVVKYIPWGFGILAALGLIGLMTLPSSPAKTLIWIYLISLLAVNMLYFTSSEFRFPAVAPLLIGAGIGIEKIAGWVRDKWVDWRIIVLAVAMLFFTHYQTTTAQKLTQPGMDYFNLGSVSLKQGDYDSAERFFLQSLAEDANFIDGHMGLGTTLLEKGDYVRAAAEFNAAGYPVTPEFLREQKALENREPTTDY